MYAGALESVNKSSLIVLNEEWAFVDRDAHGFMALRVAGLIDERPRDMLDPQSWVL